MVRARKKAGTKADKKKPSESSFYSTIKTVVIALVMALLIKYSVIEAYNVPTGSMEDTILIGDFLIANKFIYGFHIPLIGKTLPGLRDPRPGDVVVFKFPGDQRTNYVKRCVAVGGQVVEVKNKVLYVDGKPFDTFPHIKHTKKDMQRGRDQYGPYRVPKGTFFMMGDNRDDSYDSRFWGPVKREFILGKALFVHWSWDPRAEQDIPRWEWLNPLTWPSSLLYNLVHFHERVRWSRLGTGIS